MSDPIDQPLPGRTPGSVGRGQLAPRRVEDTRLAPIVAFPACPVPVGPVQSPPNKVPVTATTAASSEAAARAHGRPTRHRVRRPGAVGGVTVRAPLLDPTRTNVRPAIQPSGIPAHPLVDQRRRQILRARQWALLRPLLAPTVLAVVLLGLFVVVFGSSLFSIRHVQTDFSGTAAQQAELRLVTGRLEGTNIIRFDGDRTARAIRSLPWVARVDVRRHLPGTVSMRVRAHDVAGAVALADGWFALAAPDGVVIAVVAPDASSMVGVARINLGLTTRAVPGDVLPAPAADVLRGTAAVGRVLPGRLASATLRNGDLTWSVRPLVGTRTIRVAVGSPTAGEIAASALSSVLARPGLAPIAVDLRTPDTPVLDIPAAPEL